MVVQLVVGNWVVLAEVDEVVKAMVSGDMRSGVDGMKTGVVDEVLKGLIKGVVIGAVVKGLIKGVVIGAVVKGVIKGVVIGAVVKGVMVD